MKKTVKALIAIVLSFATILTFVSCGIGTKQIVIDFYEDETFRSFLTTDTDAIAEILDAELPDEEISLIPVCSFGGGMFADDAPIHIFAIDKENASALGLEEMADDTMYFAETDAEEINLAIDVTEEVDGGFNSYDIAHMTLKAKSGVEGKLLETVQENFMTPSTTSNPTCFVNMETYAKIASAHMDKDIEDIEAEVDNSELLSFEGVVIETNKAGRVGKILEAHNYY